MWLSGRSVKRGAPMGIAMSGLECFKPRGKAARTTVFPPTTASVVRLRVDTLA
jgi:hypothetical protein